MSKTFVYQASANFNFSKDTVMSVASDFERYNEFIPWYKESSIIEKNGNQSLVKSKVQFGPKVEYILTEDTFLENEITINAIEGMFSFLESKWLFENVKEGSNDFCNVNFYIHFQFGNFLLESIASLAYTKSRIDVLSRLNARLNDITGMTQDISDLKIDQFIKS